ncbi:uncharacterized protein VTP21DRAFT_1758 [Calcarisporiella thermophila]|uniref:uncharacterized protein n=1 Tax=Calcarisporiella thermophila TaxID=911321 RepID=UPI0037433277
MTYWPEMSLANQQNFIQCLETLCEEFFNPKSTQGRVHAERLLDYACPTFAEDTLSTDGEGGIGIGGLVGGSYSRDRGRRPSGSDSLPIARVPETPAESVQFCQLLLESSPSPYAQMFAAHRLRALALDHFSLFTPEQKLDLRNFTLRYLYQHPTLSTFVIQALSQVFATVTKLGWFDSDEFRNIMEDMLNFNATIEHRIVGLQVLATLVLEMNLQVPQKNMVKQRKTSTSFRDSQLLDIFKFTISTLQSLVTRQIPFEHASQGNRIKESTLSLCKNCLAFDFIGTAPDESIDDTGSVQVPSTWRSLFDDNGIVKTFFEAYTAFDPPYSSHVMECLVYITSVRRSLFNEEERGKFVGQVMQEIRKILITSQGMNDSNNYHEFCRMLAKFRSIYQMSEISTQPEWIEWMELVANFSIKGFSAWQWAPNSTTYLLTFWSKMASGASNVRNIPPDVLENICANLVPAFISSRVEAVSVILEGSMDDPMENEELLIEQLELLSNIARCKYPEACVCINTLFDPVASQYQELYQRASTGTMNEALKALLEVTEVKFAWLVYIIGGFLGARIPYSNSEEQDTTDAELATKVLQLMDINRVWLEQQGQQIGSDKLEAAFLFFFQQLRKSYIGEPSSRATEFYKKMSENFGINDQSMLLNVIMSKIESNLLIWASHSEIVGKSLKLLNDIASGYSSLKLVRRAPKTKRLLSCHSAKNFPFLGANLSHRLSYYNALGRLLFAEENPEADFDDFMKPFDEVFDELSTLDSLEAFRQPAVRETVLGIFRDLRGFLLSVQSRKNFLLFFEWFYPQKLRVMLRALEAWVDDSLAVVILKFFNEFCYNRSQRLNFDVSSANGILLFRETSKLLCTYGQYTVHRQVEESNKYAAKYKGIAVCFSILHRSLSGRYVSFGVFSLYGDTAFEAALNTFFEMMLSTPLADMMAFPKLARSFYALLDVFSNEHMMSIADPGSMAFLYIMQALAEGVRSLDTQIATDSCNALDHLCTFLIQQSWQQGLLSPPSSGSQPLSGASIARRRARQSATPHWLWTRVMENASVLPYMLSTVFGTVLFEEQQIQWSLSRPLYVLYILNRALNNLDEYKRRLIKAQLPERRNTLEMALNQLEQDIEWNLSTRDRDRFSNGLNNFRRELNNTNLILIPPDLSSPAM